MNHQNINPITRIESLYASLSRALQLHAAGKIHSVEGQPFTFVVESPVGFYVVTDGMCTCPDATDPTELLQGYCQHRLAVGLFKEDEERKERQRKEMPESKELYQ